MTAAYNGSFMHALARMLPLCYSLTATHSRPWGAGFYGLRKATDFRETIMKLIMEGGDADT